MPERRSCLFCGASSGLTREHVWPRWLATILPASAKTVHSFTQDGRPSREPYLAPDFSVQVRLVCRRCNNGWMAELENDARPPLTPMITAQGRVTLEPESARIVAAWLLKTAMTMEHAHTGPRVVPPEQRRYLAAHVAAPPRVQVWIGMRAAPDGYTRWDHSAWGEPVANGYMVALSVGVLSAFMLSPPHNKHDDAIGEAELRADDEGRLSSLLVPLTDTSGSSVTWPPRWSVDDDGLDAMFAGFTGRPE